MTTPPQTTRDKVKISLEYLMKVFNGKFPRHIMTAKSNGQIIVNSVDEALNHFEEADWIDCRVAVFGLDEITNIKPNLIFIDQDDKTQLEYVKARIKRILGVDPFVISTGNGFAIIVPIVMESLKNTIYKNFNAEDISKKFLLFCKNYLANNKADPANHPTLKSCLLRVPHTINSKNGNIVKIIETWDGQRVDVHELPFILHLQKELEENDNNFNNIKINPKNYSWIENILSSPKIYRSNRLLGLVITRYLMNVKKVSKSDAVEIIKKWDDRYNTNQINYELSYALKIGKIPVGLKLFIERNPDFAEEFKKIPNLTKYNPLVKEIKSFSIENYDADTQKFKDAPNTISYDQIGYSKTKDLFHIHLMCYGCNNRGAGGYEPHEKSYRFHERSCVDIRYLTREEEKQERFNAKYVLPMLLPRRSKISHYSRTVKT